MYPEVLAGMIATILDYKESPTNAPHSSGKVQQNAWIPHILETWRAANIVIKPHISRWKGGVGGLGFTLTGALRITNTCIHPHWYYCICISSTLILLKTLMVVMETYTLKTLSQWGHFIVLTCCVKCTSNKRIGMFCPILFSVSARDRTLVLGMRSRFAVWTVMTSLGKQKIIYNYSTSACWIFNNISSMSVHWIWDSK